MAIALTSLRQVNYRVALSLTASTPRAQPWVLFPAVSSGMTARLAPAGVDIYAACGSAGMLLATITAGTLPVTVLHTVLRQSATRRRCSSCVRFASGRCTVLNDTAYTFASGTSMAVPHAAGLAAIYLAGTLHTTKTVHGTQVDSVNQGQQWQPGGRSQAISIDLVPQRVLQTIPRQRRRRCRPAWWPPPLPACWTPASCSRAPPTGCCTPGCRQHRSAFHVFRLLLPQPCPGHFLQLLCPSHAGIRCHDDGTTAGS